MALFTLSWLWGALLALVAAVPLLVAVHRWRRARRWAAKRDAQGRPVRLLPVMRDPWPLGLGMTLRFVRASQRNQTLSVVRDLIDSDGLTTRLDATLDDHAFVLTGDPEVVAWVMARNFDNYDKGINFVAIFVDFLGQVTKGERARRKAEGGRREEGRGERKGKGNGNGNGKGQKMAEF